MTVQAAAEGHWYPFPLWGASLYLFFLCGRCPVQLGHPVPTAAVIGLGGGAAVAQVSQSRVKPRLWAEVTPFLWSQTRGPVNLEPPAAISAPQGA